VIFFSSSQLWNCNLFISFLFNTFFLLFLFHYLFGVPPTINCSLFIRVMQQNSLMNWPYNYVWQAWINLQLCCWNNLFQQKYNKIDFKPMLFSFSFFSMHGNFKTWISWPCLKLFDLWNNWNHRHSFIF
jgi:hypothetical protein